MFKKLNKMKHEKSNKIKISESTNLNNEITITKKHTKTDKVINVILCIIVFLIPLLTIPRMVALNWYNIVKYIALLICGTILLICIILKRKELKFDLIDKTLLVFLALIILSTIFSINIPKSILGEENRYEGLLTFIVYFLTYYCAKYYFQYNKLLKNFAIIVVTITSVIGILQYYNRFPLYKMFNIPYITNFASSTFGNRNFFASFLSIIVPLFMALYIIKKKKVYLVMSLLSFFGILVSMTRSSWLGLTTASIFGLIYIIKNYSKDVLKRTIHIAIGFIIIFFFVLMPPNFISKNIHGSVNINSLEGRFNMLAEDFETIFGDSTKEQKASSGAGRIGIWVMTLKSIAQDPLLGTGPDTLKDGLIHNALEDVLIRVESTRTIIDKAHNEYLQIAATIGIPALIVYLAFLAQILFKDKNLFKHNSTFILIVPIVSYLTQAFFNISTIGVSPIFWLLLGVVQNEKFKSEM